MNRLSFSRYFLGFIALWAGLGCQPAEPGPQGDSHTNWLRTCAVDRDCGVLSCVCGVCTAPCSTEDECGAAVGSSCLSRTHAGTVAACAGQAPPVAGMCLPTCSLDRECGEGQACVAGACQPLKAPTARVAIDSSVELQPLSGFGATVGYAEDELTTFSNKAALEQAMFAGLGLDVLRFRNRYGEVPEATLRQASNIVAAAQRSLGRAPLVLLTSWSPPAQLKQNGATFCAGPTRCTLTTNESGAFDYAALGAHWRSSIEAYARAGFVPDFIGIQNNPDWSPPGGAVFEACKFLPSEGSTTEVVDGASVSFSYPGYDRAFSAVTTELDALTVRPRVLAPELSRIDGAQEYLKVLAPTRVAAVAHHMYGSDPTTPDFAGLEALAELGSDMRVPLFQTEMQADGFGTALLIHHALAEGGAAMYLQTALVAPLFGPTANSSALIALDGGELVLQDPYFAMSHFSRFTDPGWVRVSTFTSDAGLLASAWSSPAHDSLTVVLLNAASSSLEVALDLGARQGAVTELRRTVFDGSERFANLGAWSIGSSIELPPRSLATVVIDE
jgi:O-glycosyl hydrolase